jgi:hypothetical protein
MSDEGKVAGTSEDFWSGFSKALQGYTQKKLAESMMIATEERQKKMQEDLWRTKAEIEHQTLKDTLEVEQQYEFEGLDHARRIQKKIYEDQRELDELWRQKKVQFDSDFANAFGDDEFLTLKKSVYGKNDPKSLQIQQQIQAWELAKNDIIAGRKPFDPALFVNAPVGWTSRLAEIGGDWKRFNDELQRKKAADAAQLSRTEAYLGRAERLGIKDRFTTEKQIITLESNIEVMKSELYDEISEIEVKKGGFLEKNLKGIWDKEGKENKEQKELFLKQNPQYRQRFDQIKKAEADATALRGIYKMYFGSDAPKQGLTTEDEAFIQAARSQDPAMTREEALAALQRYKESLKGK